MDSAYHAGVENPTPAFQPETPRMWNPHLQNHMQAKPLPAGFYLKMATICPRLGQASDDQQPSKTHLIFRRNSLHPARKGSSHEEMPQTDQLI